MTGSPTRCRGGKREWRKVVLSQWELHTGGNHSGGNNRTNFTVKKPGGKRERPGEERRRDH